MMPSQRETDSTTGGGMDRRAFLSAAPRRLFQTIRILVREVTDLDAAEAASQGARSARRLAVLDVSRCLAWGDGLPALSAVPGTGQAGAPRDGYPGAAPACPATGVAADRQAGECRLCYLRCPLKDAAILLADGRPTIVASACDGCGVCVEACRTVNDLGAIKIVSV